ncbi:efflux RND transporter periplasmic adaptor subunit [Thermaurantiacus sp.]
MVVPKFIPPARPLRLAVREKGGAVLALALAALVAGCSILGDSGPTGGGKGTAGGPTAGPGGQAGPGGPGMRPPSVVVDVAKTMEIVDRIEAVGTAVANEQADLNSTVTERIARVNYADGAFVPKGAVIAELVRSEQGAQLAQFEARQREAELQLERIQALMKQGFATRAQLEAAQAAVDVARGQVAAARSQVGDRVIRAPFSGWLSLRRVSPGAVVNAGTTVATIVDYSRIKLDFQVPELFLGAIRPGLPIEAEAAAFPGETFRGEISSIDPIVDPVTRSATVRAILPNPERRLRPGMLMTLNVEARPRTAVVVPELAIVGLGETRSVFRLDAENRAKRVDVRTGQRREGLVEIVEGLNAGDRIVVEGTVKVRDGLVVNPVSREQLAGAPAPEGPGR